MYIEGLISACKHWYLGLQYPYSCINRLVELKLGLRLSSPIDVAPQSSMCTQDALVLVACVRSRFESKRAGLCMPSYTHLPQEFAIWSARATARVLGT